MDPLDRFAFSQSSLQDFVDCRRRFLLRYLRRLAWPALQSEPARENESYFQRGKRFHRLVQQYLLGVPVDRLARLAEADPDENLQRWWDNFTGCLPAEMDGKRYVETTLAAPLGSFRLAATYDLVLIGRDGQVVIYDWKTNAHRPRRARLQERLQTRVYPYLIVQAGGTFNGRRGFSPEQVRMIYWFAEPGHAPEVFDYSSQRWEEDERCLLGLVDEIRRLAGHNGRPSEENFPMCGSNDACLHCVYRSLCDRGTRGGPVVDENYEPEEENLDFELEQIAEITF
jgi:hypothetical protein